MTPIANNKKSAGFTLIELLVVIAIIAIPTNDPDLAWLAQRTS